MIPVTLIALTSCKREKAVWDTDWQVPLLRDTLALEDVVSSQYLSIENGYYVLSVDRTIFELKLKDVVDIPDTTVDHTYAISLSSFTVPPGTSFVNDTQEHIIDLGDVELKKARVKSGGIVVSVKNPVGTKCFFTVELPGVTKNGTTLTQHFVAPAGNTSNPGVVNGFVDLSGYDMDLRGENLGSFNRIQTRMLVTSDPQGPSVALTNQDSVRFSFTMNDLEIDYARGYFGNTLFADTLTEYIAELGKITSGTIDLQEAELEFELVNSMKVNGKLMLTQLKGINETGNAVSLTHPTLNSWITLNGATGNENNLHPSSTTVTFNGQNSNLEEFMENHGATNEIGYKIQLNPWGNTTGGWDEIFPQSSLKVNLKANMPLAIGLDDFTLQDTFDFSIDQNFNKTHIASGKLWMNVTNGFPMSGEVTLYLMTASGTVLGTLSGSQEVKSSVFGTVVNGIRQKQTYVEFDVPESLVEALEKTRQLSVRVKLNTPNEFTNLSEQVLIPAGAFFGFKVGAKLKVENRI